MPVARNIFVLSGGGSRGAGQVGMLRTLWAAGVTPDLLVGGSVGAINACFVGSHPDAAGVEKLAASWLEVSEESLCGRRRGVVVNVARRRPYLFSSDRLRRLVSEWVPTYHLENLAIPVRVATTNIATGRPVHHDHGYIPDLVAASAALPAIFPPVVLGGPDGPVTHVDAGVSENVPLSGAAGLARPGDRVWVLDVTRTAPTHRTLRSPLDVLIASLAASVRNRDEPTFHPDAGVVRCKLDESFDCGPVFDFSRTAELIKLGEGAAATALEAASSPSPSPSLGPPASPAVELVA
jgi:NTE family protein